MKHLFLKKIISMLLCLFMLVSALASCGGNKEPDNSQSDETNESLKNSENSNNENNSDTSTGIGDSTESETDDNTPDYEIITEYTDGLVFKLDANGSSYYVADYEGSETEVQLPTVYNGLPVTSIGDNAFKDNNITNIIIPNSIESIGGSAFSHTNLTNITIPNSIESISDYAFLDCANMKEITLPDSVSSIGGLAFYDTAYYKNESNWENGVLYIGNHLIRAKEEVSGSYVIKAGTITIADEAFNYCENITSITIPNSVTSISNSAFFDCESLISVTIPSSVTHIGTDAFHGCIALMSITIPNSVISIGDQAFMSCISLTSITIPDSVTSIGDAMFGYCKSLTSINIPESVTSIGKEAFKECNSLTSITIPDGVTSIGDSAFEYCDSLTSITLPFIGNDVLGSEATHLGYIFGGFPNTNFSVPKSLKTVIVTKATSIADKAFYGCTNLTNITIPDSVTSIGDQAFSFCENLTSITFEGTLSEWNAITKDYDLNDSGRGTEVICSDGVVKL